jgi:thiol:disulfide interchange protein DsbD
MITIVDFYADWSAFYKEMEKWLTADLLVRLHITGMQVLLVDVTANNADDRVLLKRFELFNPPCVLLFSKGAAASADGWVIGCQGRTLGNA